MKRSNKIKLGAVFLLVACFCVPYWLYIFLLYQPLHIWMFGGLAVVAGAAFLMFHRLEETSSRLFLVIPVLVSLVVALPWLMMGSFMMFGAGLFLGSFAFGLLSATIYLFRVVKTTARHTRVLKAY